MLNQTPSKHGRSRRALTKAVLLAVLVFSSSPPAHAAAPSQGVSLPAQDPCVPSHKGPGDPSAIDSLPDPSPGCRTWPDRTPVIRTPPVLVAPDLEPIHRPRPVLKQMVAPALLEFLRQTHARILEAREYPLSAIKLGLQGTATVKLTLQPDGRSHHLRIRKSSGHGTLDEAALAAVQKVLPLQPPPEAGHRPLELDIPISFALK